VSLADYDGKVVVLYFWATWCAPCAISGPAIQDLHVRYGHNGKAAVVGVHYDDRGDAVGYQKKQGYTFDVIPDGRDVVSKFGIKKIPSFVIVGDDGTVLLNQIGFVEGDEVEFERVINAHIESSN
jgi:thiol-disulfide isomerase/thioredoxin